MKLVYLGSDGTGETYINPHYIIDVYVGGLDGFITVSTSLNEAYSVYGANGKKRKDLKEFIKEVEASFK